MSEYKERTMKEFINKGCECSGKYGAWSVEGPTFCKWLCMKCNKETTVYWEDE